jgi:hypothetical protein
MKIYRIIYLFIIVLISCDNKPINFEGYIKNNLFNNKEILENNIYQIENLNYKKIRMVYDEEGTYFSIYENPNNKNKIFDIKYWTEVIPIEIVFINSKFWVKINTKDNRKGWVNAMYIEMFL